jgi:lipopolysaccharide transport system ATP-binding protein
VTFHLVDEYSNLVFVGGTGLHYQPKYFSNGRISAYCEIPSNLMNHGTFTISKLLLVRNRGIVVYSTTDCISFEIITSPLDAFGWMGKKEGIVKPKLNWQLSHDSRY